MRTDEVETYRSRIEHGYMLRCALRVVEHGARYNFHAPRHEQSLPTYET